MSDSCQTFAIDYFELTQACDGILKALKKEHHAWLWTRDGDEVSTTIGKAIEDNRGIRLSPQEDNPIAQSYMLVDDMLYNDMMWYGMRKKVEKWRKEGKNTGGSCMVPAGKFMQKYMDKRRMLVHGDKSTGKENVAMRRTATTTEQPKTNPKSSKLSNEELQKLVQSGSSVLHIR